MPRPPSRPRTHGAPSGRDRRQLERLTDGTLDDRTLEDLQQRADTDEDIARQVDAYTPIDGLHLERITDEGLTARGRKKPWPAAVWFVVVGATIGLLVPLIAWFLVRT